MSVYGKPEEFVRRIVGDEPADEPMTYGGQLYLDVNAMLYLFSIGEPQDILRAEVLLRRALAAFEAGYRDNQLELPKEEKP